LIFCTIYERVVIKEKYIMARKKKTLLTEGEMRRFMKLANIAPIQEMGGMYPGARDEKERDEKDPMTEQEDEEVEMDMGMDMDAPEADMPDMDEPEMDMDGRCDRSRSHY
jgi:hypothetical protein